jgi:hypothetical protein
MRLGRTNSVTLALLIMLPKGVLAGRLICNGRHALSVDAFMPASVV